MSTLRQDIVDLRRSIARNHAALPALTRLLDFNEMAIAALRPIASGYADDRFGPGARRVLALLDKENI
jgi:hypothetical protein